VWRRVAIEASESAFDEGIKTLEAFTGAHVPKHQFEERVIRTAQEFEASYADDPRRASANPPSGASAHGLPNATGVIEGTARRLVEDGMILTVGRCSLIGTEDVDDLDICWQFHGQQEHERKQASHYADPQVPEAVPSAALSPPSSPQKSRQRNGESEGNRTSESTLIPWT